MGIEMLQRYTGPSVPFKKRFYEYLRIQAKQKFERCRATWIDTGRWVLPHRIKWMQSQIPGERNNQHIVDTTHILAHQSYVAGFLEGNTSSSRPWVRIKSRNDDKNNVPENKKWLQIFTDRIHDAFFRCNFYLTTSTVYGDLGCFNTAAVYVEEIKGNTYWHDLMPGAYYIINNGRNEAVVLVREFSLSVKGLIDTYGRKKKDGSWDWSNFSSRVQKLYFDANYTQMVDIAHIIRENDYFDPKRPQVGMNKPWISCTYELGSTSGGQYYQDGQEFGAAIIDNQGNEVYLNMVANKRKPFVVCRGPAGANFEYGEKGPTTDALGVIKSLNKKAIGKDQALEHMLRPPLQGPSSLKKSYVTTAPNSYVPLDPNSMAKQGLKSIFDINPAIEAVVQDVGELRQLVNKHYFADYLLYLSQNPKTRTAEETTAVVREQQLVIGPHLQSLNWTWNVPVIEFMMDWVLWEDPFLPPPPKDLAGQFLQAEFVSVFAQAMKAADLPSIQQFMQSAEQLAPANPKVWDKVNIDKYMDLLEDRLYLPEGLVNPQGKVDAMREQAQAQAQRQQTLQETLPAMAAAHKDIAQAQAVQGQTKK